MLNDAVFDLDSLRLLTDSNPEIEAELALLFCQTAESCLERLEVLLHADGVEQWRRVIHELKGAAANIHANAMAQLCHQSEHLQTHDLRAPALAEIRSAYSVVKPHLDALAT